MLPRLGAALLALASFAQSQVVGFDATLVGTWSSKSNSTLTGSGFYDPVNEKMIEPDHTGISYSFTIDGFYETAYYRSVSNPNRPDCAKAVMQWQHGTYTKHANGSLLLVPYAVDGRQLMSDPCAYSSSIYTRFNTTELFKGYAIYVDPYHTIDRLDLVRFDGQYLMPLYRAYSSPQMLPTSTLNPTTTSTAGATATGKSRVKRDSEEIVLPLNHRVLQKRTPAQQRGDNLWWLGVAATGLGGFLYLCF